MSRGRGGRGCPSRGRGNYGIPNSVNTGPNYYERPDQPPFEIDFTEDVQMSGPNHQQWGNSFDRKRNGTFQEFSAKKPRLEGSNSLLPTPSQPVMRGRPMNNQFGRPGFYPPLPPPEMPPIPPRRFFRPCPRGLLRPMGPLALARGPGPARFSPPHFSRPGPPPPPVSFRSVFPHPHQLRGLPPRGGPYPNRGFGGVPRMFRP